MKQRKLEKTEIEPQENGLPLGWEWSNLREIVLAKKGKKPKTLSVQIERGSLPYVDIKAFEKGIYTKFGMSEDGILASSKDIFLVWDGARSGLTGKGLRGLIGSTIMSLTPRGFNRDYLLFFLQSRYSDINSNTRGTGIPHVNPDYLWPLQIPCAPLDEQRRIVYKLQKVLERVEKANASINKVSVMLNEFRQAVLSAACSGKLVEQDPNDEPASILLERVRAGRKKKWLGELIAKRKDPKEFTYKEPVEPDMSELPELPGGWAWVYLPELGSLSRGMSKHRPRNEKKLYGGKYPFIQTGDIRNSPDIITEFSQTYNEEGLKQSKLWPKNTLAITIAANIAETAILGFSACFPDSVVGLIADENLCDIHYVHYFIRTIKGRLSNFASATAQKNLNIRTLNKVAVALPPLGEQKRIVARVQELFKFADTIEASVTKAQANAERIKQALLAKAFRGELVEQDPNDEPASVLLRRIKEDRSASVKAKS